MERREIAIRGVVQGVGFRPFVYTLAGRHAVRGCVRNTGAGVLIEVEGDPAVLEEFQRELLTNPPPFTSIEECWSATVPVRGEVGFRIESSTAGAATAWANIRVSPDVATCDACLAELLDPANRRFAYPFITCATCGPRLTVITAAPYDRERTTMARFTMCAECRREYEDPTDRRFHAETIGCAACGPRLHLIASDRTTIPGDPIAGLVASLLVRRTAAIKGIGGYHLACDATDPGAVSRLRARKHRDEKPFAVMFESLAAIERDCELSDAERRLLTSPARPIVIVNRRSMPLALTPSSSVAPGSASIGAMLPSTPVQHLILRAVGRPLVMTSGNRSQEPIASDDDDALERLATIADVFLTNDRPIRVRCDDGVSRVAGGIALPVRRSRGEAPRPLRLPRSCPVPMLAVGGHLKNTFALGRGDVAFISHHIGDLEDRGALDAFERDIDLYQSLFDITPEVIAHDLHPDYHSTRYALERAASGSVRTIGVQHHHAHVASCLAEQRIDGPVIGVAFDGSGYGPDGTIWGGEFLVGDARHVRRMGHLRTVPLPGGEQAVREPWRMAMSHLLDAAVDPDLVTRRHADAARVLQRMISRGFNSPATSSVGRLFDAVAAIAGVSDVVSFEGQAAMQLEWLSRDRPVDVGYACDLESAHDTVILDTRSMIRAVAADARAGVGAAAIGRRFHRGLAAAIAEVCVVLRERTGIDAVALSGGVFVNALLTDDGVELLSGAGFKVYRHRLVPPNDGGLSLGQLAVAASCV